MQKLTKIWFKLKSKLFYFVASVVTIGSLLPKDSVPPLAQSISDKTLHILMYWAFSASLFWFLENKKSVKQNLWLSLSISIFFGALMEFLQWQCIPGRFGSVLDLIANIIGVLVFVSFYKLKTQIFRN